MNYLERVLSCPSLPSLPTIAAELLELTSDDESTMADFAILIQQDQALAAQILRTANSSYYGLTQQCASIQRAMTLVGINTVKSLVLGLSLIDATKGVGSDGGFDLAAHWRRAIYSAASAQFIASTTMVCDADEAFTAALFQDIGMLAAFVALGDTYEQVITGVPHAELCSSEQSHLEFDHAEAGSKLAENWKLPESIAVAVRYHHAADSYEGEHAGLVRTVALGGMVAEAFFADPESERMSEMFAGVKSWFEQTPIDVGVMLEQIAESAVVLAELFDCDVGDKVNIGELMDRAREQGVEHQIAIQRRADEFMHRAATDGLTGIANRSRFDEALNEQYYNAQPDGDLAVLFMDADKFKNVNDTHGHQAGDAVLVELAQRVTATIGEHGLVCRYGGEEFAVILPGASADRGAELAEDVRNAIEASPFDLREVPDASDELWVTISVGVSAFDAADRNRIDSPKKLVLEADQAVYAAKQGGRNCVRVFGRLRGADPLASEAAQPAVALQEAKGSRVLLVEDDALSATLLKSLLERQPSVSVDWVQSGEDAWERFDDILSGKLPRPTMVVCDQRLPGMTGLELLAKIRGHLAEHAMPFILISASDDAGTRSKADSLGATAFLPKGSLVKQLPNWIKRMTRPTAGIKAA